MIRKEFVKRLNLKGRRFLGMLLAICMMTGSMVGCGKKKEHKLPIKQDEVSVNEVVDEKADITLDTTIVSDLQEVDHYTKELNSSNGNVKINIDAPVKKVEMDNYPVVKVRREKLDDAILEKVASVLNPSDRFVDGNSEKDIDIKFRNVADLKDEYSGISDSDCETGKIDYEYYSNLMEDGELFGFVGANGAGKTTTMRICVGLLGADSGEVYIDGKRMLSNHRALSRKVGYVPDFFGVYNAFTAMEYMQFFAASYGLVGEDADRLCMDLLRLVKLDHKAETDVNGLSRGMKQRLCLARALVHNPDILFLDEPASGLDPRARF